MATAQSSKKQASAKPSSPKPTMESKGNDKTPAKPISLYPMSEEEALQRLLRVPPGKGGRGQEN